MRAKTPKILVLAAISLCVPAAWCRPHKPAPKAAHTSAPLHHSGKSTRHEVAASRHHDASPARHKAGRHAIEAPVVERKSKKSKHKLRDLPDPPAISRVHGRHKAATQPEPRHLAHATAPAPLPEREEAPAAEPDIHVTHNRKQHLTPAPQVGSASQAIDKEEFIGTSEPLSDVSSPFASTIKPLPPVPTAKTLPTKPLAPLKVEPEMKPVMVTMTYDKRGRVIMPPALKGSHEILIRQNQVADSDGLMRIQDDADLDEMRQNRSLVAIPDVAGMQTDMRLPANRRYCRPWTAEFLVALARAHYARFHTPLQVNSAVRTVAFQQKLLRTNGNAAPSSGETASPHLTGQAVDIAKHGLSLTEIAWLRGYLLPLVQQGKVDVEEEFQQACFHISVYKAYQPQPAVRRVIAEQHHAAGSTLAVAMP